MNVEIKQNCFPPILAAPEIPIVVLHLGD